MACQKELYVDLVSELACCGDSVFLDSLISLSDLIIFFKNANGGLVPVTILFQRAKPHLQVFT